VAIEIENHRPTVTVAAVAAVTVATVAVTTVAVVAVATVAVVAVPAGAAIIVARTPTRTVRIIGRPIRTVGIIIIRRIIIRRIIRLSTFAEGDIRRL